MSKKILLADDSITIQKVVELTFSDGDYEVHATNNGTRAIEEIPKVKPDIILSDIIMPEKNGYELCEWVKSHPEYRHIPVILLTGTFEPFDPDRAEKAGCDAVVTKPFESQSLIQKVEELIGASAPAAPEADGASEAPPAEESSVFAPPPPPAFDEPEPSEAAPETFAPPSPPSFEMGEPDMESTPFEGSESGEAPTQSAPFPPAEEEPRPHGDVFGDEVPSGEDDDTATRMIPKMSMDDIQRIRDEQQAEPEETPANEPPPIPEPEEIPQAPALGLSEEPEHSPFDAPSADSSFEDDATRVIPKMSMDEIQRMQVESESSTEPEAAPFGDEPAGDAPMAASPFGADETTSEPDEQPQSGFGGSELEPGFSEDSRPAFGDEQPPAYEDRPAASFTEEEPPAASDESEETTEEFDDSSTRLIPKMAFEDAQRMQEETSSPAWQEDNASSPEWQEEEASSPSWQQDEAEPEPPETTDSPAFGMGAPGSSDEAGAVNPFAAGAGAEEETWTGSEAEEPGSEEESVPFREPEPELLPPPPHPPEEPVLQEPEPEATAGSIAADESLSSAALSEEQVDRIARRVVELLSDKTIREIAWEVIPETAEMIVRERIKELEEA